MADAHWELRLFSWTFSVLAIIALILAGTGVYGVTAHVVARRRQEIAVRLAGGAPAAAVRGLLFAGGIRVLGPGLLFGLAITLVGGKLVEGILFRVSLMDSTVLLASVGLISLVVLLANYVPLRRIDQASPMRFLREE